MSSGINQEAIGRADETDARHFGRARELKKHDRSVNAESWPGFE